MFLIETEYDLESISHGFQVSRFYETTRFLPLCSSNFVFPPGAVICSFNSRLRVNSRSARGHSSRRRWELRKAFLHKSFCQKPAVRTMNIIWIPFNSLEQVLRCD